jgi:hypothetical protein
MIPDKIEPGVCENCLQQPGKPVHFYQGKITNQEQVRSGKTLTTTTSYSDIKKSDPVYICFDCARIHYIKSLAFYAVVVFVIAGLGITFFTQEGGLGKIFGGVLALVGGIGIMNLISKIFRLSSLHQADEQSDVLHENRVAVAIEAKKKLLSHSGYDAIWAKHPNLDPSLNVENLVAGNDVLKLAVMLASGENDAARALAKIGNSQAINALVSTLQSQHLQVNESMKTSAFDALVSILTDEKDYGKRNDAAKAIAKITDPQIKAQIVNRLKTLSLDPKQSQYNIHEALDALDALPQSPTELNEAHRKIALAAKQWFHEQAQLWWQQNPDRANDAVCDVGMEPIEEGQGYLAGGRMRCETHMDISLGRAPWYYLLDTNNEAEIMTRMRNQFDPAMPDNILN